MKNDLSPRYALAAMAVCLVLLVPPPASAETPTLRADQQRAIDTMLREVDPAQRAFAREQLVKSFAPMSEAQVAMMMNQYGKRKTAAAKPAPTPVAETTKPASPADIAYNQAQANPVIRKNWAVQKAFDDFVDTRMKAACPAPHSVARYGSGWRYEFADLAPNWVRASDSADLNVSVMDEAAVQKDGRYQYDFSKVRVSFDRAKVGAEIDQACKEHTAQGHKFLAQIDPLIAANNFDAAYKLEQRAISWSDPQTKALTDLFKDQDPRGDELMLAFIDAKKLK